MKLTTPNLIATIKRMKLGEQLLRDDSLRYVVLLGRATMRPIVRTGEELFTQTVARRAKGMTLAVNGNYYGLTRSGMTDAYFGHDPVDPAATIIEGEVVLAGRVIAGSSRPSMFFFAEVVGRADGKPGPGWHFRAGRGDPPKDSRTVAALGGLGPLIVNTLPYGIGNMYRKGHTGPVSGPPDAGSAPFLLQRNNETLRSTESRPPTTGKTILAYSMAHDALLIGVQENGLPPGQSYRYLVQALAHAQFSDAVFADGSDSAMLWHDRHLVVRLGEDKDETITVGLGFAQRAPAPAAKHPPKAGQ